MIRAAVLAALLAAPAAAQSTFAPPEGCTASLTVQSKNCEVTHIYMCAADAPGDQRSVTYDGDGLLYLDRIDAETQWLEAYHARSGLLETLITPADDPASLSELIATGIDSYDFRLDNPEGDIRVVGYDQIVGAPVTIDGETLLPLVFENRFENDTGVYMRMSGAQYVSERHGRFFAGTFEVTEDGDTHSWDSSPVDFIYPGEPGFLDNTPRYECEANLIRFAPDQQGVLR